MLHRKREGPRFAQALTSLFGNVNAKMHILRAEMNLEGSNFVKMDIFGFWGLLGASLPHLSTVGTHFLVTEMQNWAFKS